MVSPTSPPIVAPILTGEETERVSGSAQMRGREGGGRTLCEETSCVGSSHGLRWRWHGVGGERSSGVAVSAFEVEEEQPQASRRLASSLCFHPRRATTTNGD
jgi:hypothetical protein